MAFPADRRRLRGALGGLAARLQATPVFPPVADYPAVVGGLLERLRTTGLYGALLDPHRDGFERLREACPWDDVEPWSPATTTRIPATSCSTGNGYGDRLGDGVRNDSAVDLAS
jgi:hypothetical protein